jgi:hypothetical protein
MFGFAFIFDALFAVTLKVFPEIDAVAIVSNGMRILCN